MLCFLAKPKSSLAIEEAIPPSMYMVLVSFSLTIIFDVVGPNCFSCAFTFVRKNNVNIRAIAQGASERNISAVIVKDDVKKALNTLHEEFFEDNTKQLNLFVMGVGNVGTKFLNQIKKQRKFFF